MKQLRRKVMKQLVASASPQELNEIVAAVLRRYDQLYVSEEVVFLSLPRYDAEERRRIIRCVLSLEQEQA